MRRNSDKKWLLAFSLFLVVLSTLPYIVASQTQGDSWVFTGFLFAVEDANSYIAKMLRGAVGDWLFRTPYTNFHQDGLFTSFHYLLLGKLAGGSAMRGQLVALFHLFRVVSIFAVVFASEAFFARFLKKEKHRRWGVVLANFGGGLGWVFLLLGQTDLFGSLPVDLISPEAFGFLAIYGLPHLALARACLLWALSLYISPIPENAANLHAQQQWHNHLAVGLRVGGFLILLGILQPLSVAIAWGVLLLHGIWSAGFTALQKTSWQPVLAHLFRSAVAVLISAPILFYFVFIFQRDPFAMAWMRQNILTSPHFAHYLLAYGLLLPFSLRGFKLMLQAESHKAGMLGLWVFIVPFCLYLPIAVQRRFAEALWVPIVTLALYGMAMPQTKKTWHQSPMVFLPALLTSLFLIIGGFQAALNPSEPLFIPSAEQEFYEEIAPLLPKNTLVLASYETGNLLPAWLPVRVVAGHGPESIQLPEYLGKIKRFFSDSEDIDRNQFLIEEGFAYLIWGPREQALGAWQPESLGEQLELLYKQGEYSLYKVYAACTSRGLK